MRHKIGRLYFRYILHSKLEAYGYNAKKLGGELQELGLIKIEGETYDELQSMPNKKNLIEIIMDKNKLTETKKGMVILVNDKGGELLGDDKIIYNFDREQVKDETLEVNNRVEFKQAFKNNSLAIARDITRTKI